jgi:hypothetical protein
MKTTRFGLACLALISFIAGCAVPGTRVSGGDKQTSPYSQSETASTTAFAEGQTIAVVTYNDGTDPANKVAYTATTRVISSGASLMGWSYSTDFGASWVYGGRVNPPSGWAVLWGDPAITTSRKSYATVFISALAIPNSKMPAAGISGSVIVTGANSYIGGACIARSTDGGKNFSNYQCVSNTEKNNTPESEKGHFYDGGSMAAGEDGAIYAGFVDVTESAIAIWRAADHNSKFVKIGNPFPGIDIFAHPRLRASPFDSSLYVAGQSSNGQVFINRFQNGNWGSPISVGFGAVYPCIPLEQDACESSTKLQVRTGPQFSYDIGAQEHSAQDAIRFLITHRDQATGRLHLISRSCDLALVSCQSWIGTSDWGTPASKEFPIDYFNPLVRAWRGFIGLPPVWMSSYNYRYGLPASGIYVSRALLAYLPSGDRIWFPVDAYKNMPVCSDLRGYWGDYDDLTLLTFKDSTPQWLRTVSDSTAACATRWQYSSDPLHVRALVFPK